MRFAFVRPAPVAEPTIEILMLETRRGAPTSTTERLYEAGKMYVVPESLAQSFFSCGAADPAEAHAQPASDAHSAAEISPPQTADAEPEAVPTSRKRAKRAI